MQRVTWHLGIPWLQSRLDRSLLSVKVMADVTVPAHCQTLGTAATNEAQGVLNNSVNGGRGVGVVADLAFKAKGKGDLPARVVDTLSCTFDAYKNDPRANDIRTAGNLYNSLSGNTTRGFW